MTAQHNTWGKQWNTNKFAIFSKKEGKKKTFQIDKKKNEEKNRKKKKKKRVCKIIICICVFEYFEDKKMDQVTRCIRSMC